MDNQIFGILTLILSSIFILFSYTYQKKENYSIAILLLMAGGLLLRIYTSADFFLHPWDEVYHAVVAKHLIHHPLMPTLYDPPLLPYAPENWTGNYIWVHKQPLTLWSMALSMYLFGVNEIALRLPSIILTTMGIGLTFYIGTYFFDQRVGWLAAFFYSINGLIIEMTAGRVPTDHIDDFFLFFIELAIFFSIIFSQKKNSLFNICAGLSIGAAILSKWLPAVIVLPMWLLIMIDSKNFSTRSIIFHFSILIAITVLTFLPWQLYIYHTFPIEANWEGSYNIKHLTQIIENHQESVYYYLSKIRINYGELIYLPLLWFLWVVLKDILNLKKWAILIWFAIPILFFSLVKTKMQGYILFACPPLFMISAAFWYMLLNHRENIIRDNKNQPVIKWGISILLVLLIVLPIRYSIERVKPFQKDRKPLWVRDLKNIQERHITKGVLFNYERPIDAMFYTDLIAYSIIPDMNTIQTLQQKGYTVIINDNGDISKDISALKDIIHIHLTPPMN